ncbi:hypothetical protein A6R68_24177, partial [Neotoma lepida]
MISGMIVLILMNHSIDNGYVVGTRGCFILHMLRASLWGKLHPGMVIIISAIFMSSANYGFLLAYHHGHSEEPFSRSQSQDFHMHHTPLH